MRYRSFEIHVPDSVLRDLRGRLTRTQFVRPSSGQAWQAGVDAAYLRQLVNYWAGEFDWRARETALNAVPHYVTEIADRTLHFVHMRAVQSAGSPPAVPLILVHGWPSCFVEMLSLAERLSDPGRHGGNPASAFDVVIPSLPGFLYSAPTLGPATRKAFAQSLHALMSDVLGYRRYGAFGADIGGGVVERLGAISADAVLGIHLIHPPAPSGDDDAPPSEAEQAWFDVVRKFDRFDQGYSEMMRTRPDTIGAALIDSPAGLAAWIIDKYHAWSDCHGDIESRFDRDTLLTILTLYWTTGCITQSFRPYLDYRYNEPWPMITVPAAVTLSAEPVMTGFPRALAERACTDLRHWSEPGRGGHFMPMEEPEMLAQELRAFFSGLTGELGPLPS